MQRSSLTDVNEGDNKAALTDSCERKEKYLVLAFGETAAGRILCFKSFILTDVLVYSVTFKSDVVYSAMYTYLTIHFI